MKILLDGRRIFWGETIRKSVEWMMDENELHAFNVPEAAFAPLYSTWYQFHQSVTDKAIEDECLLATRLGMRTVILDDGWQTEDGNRGYAFCGDWRPTPEKFPNMASHVAKVHETGMKYIVWYGVPFIGWSSEAYKKFEGKFLYTDWGNHCAVLDPRFPEVREESVMLFLPSMMLFSNTCPSGDSHKISTGIELKPENFLSMHDNAEIRETLYDANESVMSALNT